MDQNNPVKGNDTGLPGHSSAATEHRLKKAAEWLGLSSPPISYEDGSILLDDALLSWCDAGGVCLDWIFADDAKGMALAYREKFERERPFYDLLRGFDEVEQGFLLDALKAQQAGAVSLQDALAVFKGKVEKYRSNP